MSTAIVVTATGEYWKGAKVLFYTLRKHGCLPDSVDCVVLGMESCNFAKAVPVTEDHSWIPVSVKNFPRVADKFFALTLDYDRIIVLDADMLCVGDCSYLWSKHIGQLPFYACRDTASVVYYQKELQQNQLDIHRIFNAGTMVFQLGKLPPNFYDELLTKIRTRAIGSYDGGDQGYLNAYFQSEPSLEIGFLPQEYNGCTDQYIPQLLDHARRIIHFTGSNVNPWDYRVSSDDIRRPLLQRWQSEWEECNK